MTSIWPIGLTTRETGDYWGKFRARQKFLQGRPLRLIEGILGQDLADMETRHFVIKSFDGPGLDGRYKLIAKDALKLADPDRAQAPELSPGFLNSAIDDNDLSATLAPSGIGNTDYPASGYLNIGGKEIVSFTRSADTLTIVRAQFNTEAVENHDSAERCQVCLYIDGEDPADVDEMLLDNYTALDTASYVPLAEWQAETGALYRRVVSALILSRRRSAT